MSKKVVIAIIAIAALVVGGAVIWHLSDHAGLDHGAAGHGAAHGHGDHHAEGHGGGPTKLALNEGEKWATDTHLRAGMSKIHDRAKPAYAAYQEGDFAAAESKELASLIRAEVNTLIEKCNLAPEADAMLHIVIGEMMVAASAMERDPASEHGVPKLVAALHGYSEHFAHPDF